MKVVIFNKYFFVNTLIYILFFQLLLFVVCFIFNLHEFDNLFINLLILIFSFAYCVISYILVPINILGIIAEKLLKKQRTLNLQHITGYKLTLVYLIAIISFCTSIWVLYDISKSPTPTEIEAMRYD